MMKFSSGMEMYNYIADGGDLYSKSEELYVFVYNDAGALCYYHIDPTEAADLAEKSNVAEEYWGGFLGFGGHVLDESKYDNDEYRYTDDWDKRKMYLAPSLEFCEKYYQLTDWENTKNLTPEILLSKPATQTIKCKVRLTHTVEMVVEADSAEAVLDWLNKTTPDEAKEMANKRVEQSFEDEIVCMVRDDAEVDYVIGNDPVVKRRGR